jgi:chromosome segregation ATPase
MSDTNGPENLTLRGLRRIGEQNDTILRKLDEAVTRLGSIERDIAGVKSDYAATQARLDNMDRRMERIERRLDLISV